MTLVLVRHGESEGNRLGVAQGQRDYVLTARGRRQAAAVAAHLAGSRAVAVYASDLARASETGEAIANALGLALEHRAALREQRFGEREGMTWEQAVARWGPELRVGAGRIPGEEAALDFRRRVAAELDALAERHREEVAICVAHIGTILVAIAHVLELPEDVYPPFSIANCSITVLEHTGGRATLGAVNDRCHLRGSDGEEEAR